MAQQFSDTLNSHQSSLGLFVTGDTYVGSNGYSLRLDGLDDGIDAGVLGACGAIPVSAGDDDGGDACEQHELQGRDYAHHSTVAGQET